MKYPASAPPEMTHKWNTGNSAWRKKQDESAAAVRDRRLLALRCAARAMLQASPVTAPRNRLWRATLADRFAPARVSERKQRQNGSAYSSSWARAALHCCSTPRTGRRRRRSACTSSWGPSCCPIFPKCRGYQRDYAHLLVCEANCTQRAIENARKSVSTDS